MCVCVISSALSSRITNLVSCFFFVSALTSLAVDRSVTASLSDARDALVNAVIDSLSAYRSSVLSSQQPGLMVPFSLRLFPLFVLALLKQKSFQTGTNARLDERIFAMCQVKNQPLVHLMLTTHPNLYRVDSLSDEGALNINDRTIPQPPILQLSVEKLSRDGAFLMDAGSVSELTYPDELLSSCFQLPLCVSPGCSPCSLPFHSGQQFTVVSLSALLL